MDKIFSETGGAREGDALRANDKPTKGQAWTVIEALAHRLQGA
jgi:hypothetical protein